MRALAWILVIAACGDNLEGNRAPAVEPFSISTQEDLPSTRTLAARDLDVGDVVTVTVAIPPEHGDVTINGLSLTYTPGPDYHGLDQFALVASDGTDDVSLTIDVTVASVEDLPFGGEDSLATNEDSPRTVTIAQLLDNDSDADGDPISLATVGDAVNGTVDLDDIAGTVTFTPDQDFHGDASFVYTVSDGKSETATLVNVIVGSVNDRPVLGSDSAVITTQDTLVTIPIATLLANDTDADGQLLTISSLGACTDCTANIVGTNIELLPASGFLGTAQLGYIVTDGVFFEAGLVDVTVNAP